MSHDPVAERVKRRYPGADPSEIYAYLRTLESAIGIVSAGLGAGGVGYSLGAPAVGGWGL